MDNSNDSCKCKYKSYYLVCTRCNKKIISSPLSRDDRLNEMKKKLTKDELKEMVRQELQGVLAEKKKAKELEKEEKKKLKEITIKPIKKNKIIK